MVGHLTSASFSSDPGSSGGQAHENSTEWSFRRFKRSVFSLRISWFLMVRRFCAHVAVEVALSPGAVGGRPSPFSSGPRPPLHFCTHLPFHLVQSEKCPINVGLGDRQPHFGPPASADRKSRHGCSLCGVWPAGDHRPKRAQSYKASRGVFA